jgi:DNA-nicking Smr family endonuclease
MAAKKGGGSAHRGASGGGDSEVKPPDPPFEDPVVIPIEDAIDLHSFQPRDIPSVVEEYLVAAKAAGLRELRIVHGKGTGVQRNIVRSILEKHPAVESFHEAPPEAGGWGATIVVLKAET